MQGLVVLVSSWSFLRWFAASFHCLQPAAQSSQQVASGSFSLAQLSTNCLSSCPPPGCTLQWASIPVLALGVILVTVNNGGGSAKSAAAAAVSSSSHGLDYVAGMVACSISGLSSAYAGGRHEKWARGGCGMMVGSHGRPT